MNRHDTALLFDRIRHSGTPRKLDTVHSLEAAVAELNASGSLSPRELERAVRDRLLHAGFSLEYFDIYLGDALDDLRIMKTSTGGYVLRPAH